jgi:hypothetical protein
MKQLAILLVALLLLPQRIFAQSLPDAPHPVASDDAEAGWDRLSMLDPYSQVSITAGGRGPIRCQDLHVDDQYLSCQSTGMFARSFDLRRTDIERVALRHDRRNFWIGVGAMSAFGFALGASQSNLGPYQPRAVNGLIGAGLIGLASTPVVLTVVRLLPGKTIYHQSSGHTQTAQ